MKIGEQNGDENIKEKSQVIEIQLLGIFQVSEMRLELTRSNDHYPLKVARLPIPPSGQFNLAWLVRLVVSDPWD